MEDTNKLIKKLRSRINYTKQKIMRRELEMLKQNKDAEEIENRLLVYYNEIEDYKDMIDDIKYKNEINFKKELGL
jgi:hypothetical protein